ncbi:MAG: beta-propeller fold lactonase family protein [Planctomycetota bacterium]|nr:beta-propeller fold lactonase family protein [Planctomycetota bacterium]
MVHHRHEYRILAGSLAIALCAACTGGGVGGGGGNQMDIVRVSNGFGELLPHKTFRLAGNVVTDDVISLRSHQDLVDNLRFSNPVHTPPVFSDAAIVPGGADGNHFIYATFTKPIGIDSVLTDLPSAQADNALTGAITIYARDPVLGSVTPVKGRAFVNGSTYGGTPEGEPLTVPLQTWVQLEDGLPVAVEVDGAFPGYGFPGTTGAFAGMQDLIAPGAFVFVADTDGDLSTFETFPSGMQLAMQITTAVRSDTGRPLIRSGLASTTVGADTLRPEIIVTPPPNSIPDVTPGGGDTDVDPLTDIRVRFTESVQPVSVGDLADGLAPGLLSGAIAVQFGPSAAQVTVPFSVMPESVYDLSSYILEPSFNFPGEGPEFAECGVFNRVTVSIHAGQVLDTSGNANQNAASTFFTTGEGPGLVNAPVTPDVVYTGRGGGAPGLSVLDLNGFGGGTGNPTFDPTDPIEEGHSNFPNNPNVSFQGGTMRPPLQAGSCTINGGSAGVFTLTKDSSLEDRIVRSPVVLDVSDIHIGWSLDVTFNNGPAPFGCLAGGGNLCAVDGMKQVATVIDGSTLNPGATNPTGIQVLIDGGPNIVGWAPHPNPPPMAFPPLCISPFLASQEPTSVDSLGGNLLVPGDPFGDPSQNIPPTGLLSVAQNAFFQGPSLPTTNIALCSTYGYRQQVGQFLYIVDRGARQVVVLNSNRMTVIDRIPLPDPTTAAVGTNLDFLAVTNQSVNSVSFIDIDPASSTFHEVVKTSIVGQGPRGIAWEPGNEDILVCNELDDSVSILSAFSLTVRKTVSANLDQPFEIAITPRQNGFGWQRNVYFAWILNRSGEVALFESGPNGVNGWGYDDVIGVAGSTFESPKAMQVDPTFIFGGVWIAHEVPINLETGEPDGDPGEGAVSNLVIESAFPGILPLNVNSLLIPQFRDLSLGVRASVGEDRLTGVPVDIAFDNHLNLSGIINWQTFYSAGSPVPLNGKSVVRSAGGVVGTNSPRLLFLAVPNQNSGPGGVDVLLLDGPLQRFDTNAFAEGVNSVDVPNVTILSDYFRQ